MTDRVNFKINDGSYSVKFYTALYKSHFLSIKLDDVNKKRRELFQCFTAECSPYNKTANIII